jgi:hypothetical protein
MGSWWKDQYVRLRIFFLYMNVILYQKLNQVLIAEGKGQYELRYILHDRLYRLRIRAHRGPCMIKAVMDEKENDVTEEIISYRGPNDDYHGQQMTPRDLNTE